MKKELLQIRIDEDLLNQLKKLASSNSISISGQVRMLIKKAVRDGE
jgi:antitoxin component of RelBE/YafQ-DinJ toxin-antitoxin module